MKKVFFFMSALLCLCAVFLYGNQASDTSVKINSYEDLLFHHTCSGQSGMGGTCSATCTDAQSCSCSSGFFSCGCGCSLQGVEEDAIAEMVDPGPERNWLIVASVLSKEKDATAQSIASEMPNVYKLAASNAAKFTSAANNLEAKFKTLPASTLQKVSAALGK